MVRFRMGSKKRWMKRAKANDMNDLGMAHWMEAEVVELLLGKPGNKLAKFPDRRMRA